MRTRDKVFLIFAIVFAGVCVRLGVWQLSRLAERRKFNSELIERAAEKPIDIRALPADTGAAHFTRVKVAGEYDFDNEITLTNRVRNGSPGVYIVTPLKIGGDTAVLVNRGWVYAPDGMTVDLGRWREPVSMTGDGFVETFRKGQGQAKSSSHENAYAANAATRIGRIVAGIVISRLFRKARPIPRSFRMSVILQLSPAS